ncbi:MAG: LysM peptidoglycan-binding domain-containing protein [Thiotrichaceae bacterium]|nr:LysM peptidoglycan-binding domain-containing protein [Thiotrichaceae bacterium]
MKKTEFLKLAVVAALSTGLVAGCASDSADEPAPSTDTQQAQAGPSAEAKNAIYSAKIKLARAEKLGYAWSYTGNMIKAAEKAAAAGDNEKAIELANKASEEAEDAIAQYHSETKRYDANQGTVEAGNDSAGDEYTVVSGDNLWNISGKESIYGNPYQWPLIYKANSDQIKDADLIYSGQVFSIPSATSSEINAAVQHAKTRGAWSIGETEASDSDYLAQ